MNPLDTTFAGDAVVYPPLRPTVLVRELGPHHRARLQQHLLALGPSDRQLRFGQMVSDEVITNYVESIDFNRDTVFGVFDDHLVLAGAAHLAYLEDKGEEGKVAEFGVSVSSNARGKGIGSALFDRAAIHGRNTHVTTLYMHCLARNSAMMHIARKAGMEVQYAYGEADAYLTLPPPSTASLLAEAVQGQVAEFDYALKRNMRNARRTMHRFWRQVTPRDES